MVLCLLDIAVSLQSADGIAAAHQSEPRLRLRILQEGFLAIQRASGRRKYLLPVAGPTSLPPDVSPREPGVPDSRDGFAAGAESEDPVEHGVQFLPVDGEAQRHAKDGPPDAVQPGATFLLSVKRGGNPLSVRASR